MGNYYSAGLRKKRRRDIIRSLRQKQVIVDYNEDLDEDLQITLDVKLYGVREIVDKSIPHYVYAHVDSGKRKQMNYWYSHDTVTLPLQSWLGEFRHLNLEIVQCYDTAAEVGTSKGETIVGRVRVPVPTTYFSSWEYKGEVFQMVEGVCRLRGDVQVVLLMRKRKKLGFLEEEKEEKDSVLRQRTRERFLKYRALEEREERERVLRKQREEIREKQQKERVFRKQREELHRKYRANTIVPNYIPHFTHRKAFFSSKTTQNPLLAHLLFNVIS